MINPIYQGQNPLLGGSAGTSGIFTGYGYDPSGNNEITTMLKNIGGFEYGPASQAAFFGAGLEPQREQAINGMIGQMGQGSVNADINANQNREFGNAGIAARNANLAAQGAGLGSGYQAGQQAGIFGGAGQQAAQYGQMQNSPEARMQRFSSLMGTIGQGEQNPYMSQLQGIWNPVQQGYMGNLQAQAQNNAWQGQLMGAIGGMASRIPMGGMPGGAGFGSGSGGGGGATESF